MTNPSDKWMQKAAEVPQPIYAGDQVKAIARALEAADKAATERAAKIAKVAWLTCDFGSIADADTMNDLCEHIAAAIRKGEQ